MDQLTYGSMVQWTISDQGRPWQTMADQNILISAVLPASPMAFLVNIFPDNEHSLQYMVIYLWGIFCHLSQVTFSTSNPPACQNKGSRQIGPLIFLCQIGPTANWAPTKLTSNLGPWKYCCWQIWFMVPWKL